MLRFRQELTCQSAAEPLFDNRDFDTLPNLQARGQPGIWEQTSMGPKTSVSSAYGGD